MTKTKAYAAQDASSPLSPWSFERREPGPRDVQFDILYCGVCHTDIHQVKNEWNGSVYPMVPGHEIVGRVTNVGSEVRKFKVGDLPAWAVSLTPAGLAKIVLKDWSNIV